jgi:hypothetical protein
MAFTPTAIVQDRSFMVVSAGVIVPAPNFKSPIVLTCKDTQGNTIKRTIVEVDATIGDCEIMLPSIESLGNDLNCRIDVIVLNNTNDIILYSNFDYILPTPPVDTIGQTANVTITAGTYTAGAVLTLTPAYENYWTLSETIN